MPSFRASPETTKNRPCFSPLKYQQLGNLSTEIPEITQSNEHEFTLHGGMTNLDLNKTRKLQTSPFHQVWKEQGLCKDMCYSEMHHQDRTAQLQKVIKRKSGIFFFGGEVLRMWNKCLHCHMRTEGYLSGQWSDPASALLLLPLPGHKCSSCRLSLSSQLHNLQLHWVNQS